jgi:hypothetical protein
LLLNDIDEEAESGKGVLSLDELFDFTTDGSI